jgi:hypothetical protein
MRSSPNVCLVVYIALDYLSLCCHREKGSKKPGALRTLYLIGIPGKTGENTIIQGNATFCRSMRITS